MKRPSVTSNVFRYIPDDPKEIFIDLRPLAEESMKTDPKTVMIYTDGSFLNKSNTNNGIFHGDGGYGAVIQKSDGSMSFLEGGTHVTAKNQKDLENCSGYVEITAVLMALSAVEKGANVYLASDNKFHVLRGLDNIPQAIKYERSNRNKEIADMWREIKNLITDKEITLNHSYIPAHKGHFGNELADILAKNGRQIYGSDKSRKYNVYEDGNHDLKIKETLSFHNQFRKGFESETGLDSNDHLTEYVDYAKSEVNRMNHQLEAMIKPLREAMEPGSRANAHIEYEKGKYSLKINISGRLNGHPLPLHEFKTRIYSVFGRYQGQGYNALSIHDYRHLCKSISKTFEQEIILGAKKDLEEAIQASFGVKPNDHSQSELDRFKNEFKGFEGKTLKDTAESIAKPPEVSEKAKQHFVSKVKENVNSESMMK